MREEVINHCIVSGIISHVIIIIWFLDCSGSPPSHEVLYKGNQKLQSFFKATYSSCSLLRAPQNALRCCPRPAHPTLEHAPEESTWESFPNNRMASRQGVNKVSVAPSPGALRSKDGCDVKSRWLCRQGGGELRSRWALQIQRSLSCKLPPMIFFFSLNYRERELEKTSDVWAVRSLNRIFSRFPMKLQEVFKLQSVHLTPWGSRHFLCTVLP